MIKLLFSFFCLFSCPCFSHVITIATMTKSDHPYLVEWIEYHKLIGVDHFFIYDNNEGDETRLILEPYIENGSVEYVKWPNLWPDIEIVWGAQPFAFQDALDRFKNSTQWFAFLDTDEFIVPMRNTNLRETLNEYFCDKPLVFLNWRLFGTSSKTIFPPGPILKQLTQCSKRDYIGNRWGKSIVQPAYLDKVTQTHINPGKCQYTDGSGEPFPYSTWDELFYTIFSVNDDLLRINHYTFRDEWFLHHVKLNWLSSGHGHIPAFQALEKNQEYCTETCTRILEVIDSEKRKNPDLF